VCKRGATNRQFAGSITDGVIWIFKWHNPSGRTMALGSTQPLTEMSTRLFPAGKGGRCVRLTTLPPSYAVVMKSGNLNFLEPSGPLQACNGTALPFTLKRRPEDAFFSFFAQQHNTFTSKEAKQLIPNLLVVGFLKLYNSWSINNSKWWERKRYWLISGVRLIFVHK